MNEILIGDEIHTADGAKLTVKDIYIEGVQGLHPTVQIAYTYELPSGKCGKETASFEAFRKTIANAWK